MFFKKIIQLHDNKLFNSSIGIFEEYSRLLIWIIHESSLTQLNGHE